MTKELEEIIAKARRLNACDKLSEISDIKSAINILLTPQGREFAQLCKFPSLDDFRKNKQYLAVKDKVYLDFGKVVTNGPDIIAVGDTEVTVYASGAKALYHIMAMHGARVEINAVNYAVVTATSVGGTIEYKTDGSAVIVLE